MRVLRMVLLGLVILALAYGGVKVAERLATQELVRVSDAATGETACVMWRPRFLHGGGVCEVDLQNAQGKVLDTARVGSLDSGLTALQDFGQVSIGGEKVTVASRQTGAVVKVFAVQGGKLRGE